MKKFKQNQAFYAVLKEASCHGPISTKEIYKEAEKLDAKTARQMENLYLTKSMVNVDGLVQF